MLFRSAIFSSLNFMKPASFFSKSSSRRAGGRTSLTCMALMDRSIRPLSSILMEGVPERYYLSPKACQGILRRASERGKKLPVLLETALMEQAASA